jgi:hypothetical protein
MSSRRSIARWTSTNTCTSSWWACCSPLSTRTASALTMWCEPIPAPTLQWLWGSLWAPLVVDIPSTVAQWQPTSYQCTHTLAPPPSRPVAAWRAFRDGFPAPYPPGPTYTGNVSHIFRPSHYAAVSTAAVEPLTSTAATAPPLPKSSRVFSDPPKDLHSGLFEALNSVSDLSVTRYRPPNTPFAPQGKATCTAASHTHSIAGQVVVRSVLAPLGTIIMETRVRHCRLLSRIYGEPCRRCNGIFQSIQRGSGERTHTPPITNTPTTSQVKRASYSERAPTDPTPPTACRRTRSPPLWARAPSPCALRA